jgi:proteasome lid subunit RPN8/RPN11
MKLNALLKVPGQELPPLAVGETRIVVAANGIFRERRGESFTSSIRVNLEDLELADHDQLCHLECSKMSARVLGTMLSFFLSAYRKHGGEAVLVLLYSPSQRRYRWYCPWQSVELRYCEDRWVPSDFVYYRNPSVVPTGYVHFGDAHSHIHAGPTPSRTDIHDEQDGMHIVVSNIDTVPSYWLEFVVDGQRFGVRPESFFADPNCLPGPRVRREWLDRIQVHRYVEQDEGIAE